VALRLIAASKLAPQVFVSSRGSDFFCAEILNLSIESFAAFFEEKMGALATKAKLSEQAFGL
jgi:hypothetical protein